ncbi:hypothetical protein BGP_3008 [Beggiatoa sp. PS]|nr:hypothetical protein BGP_3008 [Beggiatoa sp. PS]
MFIQIVGIVRLWGQNASDSGWCVLLLQIYGGVIKLMHRFRGWCNGGGIAIFVIVVLNLPTIGQGLRENTTDLITSEFFTTSQCVNDATQITAIWLLLILL